MVVGRHRVLKTALLLLLLLLLLLCASAGAGSAAWRLPRRCDAATAAVALVLTYAVDQYCSML
jgi:hypothetical protein